MDAPTPQALTDLDRVFAETLRKTLVFLHPDGGDYTYEVYGTSKVFDSEEQMLSHIAGKDV